MVSKHIWPKAEDLKLSPEQSTKFTLMHYLLGLGVFGIFLIPVNMSTVLTNYVESNFIAAFWTRNWKIGVLGVVYSLSAMSALAFWSFIVQLLAKTFWNFKDP